MNKLKEDIEKFVTYSLSNHEITQINAPKVIHDTITGSNLFQPHEIALIDLPIIQRLRRISQVGFTSLVFPSANHHRFDHTIGVAVMAEKLFSSLKLKIEKGQEEEKEPYINIDMSPEYMYKHLRTAAILHDCGHGPFSHVSEQIFEHYTDLIEIKKNTLEFNSTDAKAHEILSYLIITSNSFRGYFKKYIQDIYPESTADIDLDFVANIIIGYSKPKNCFLVEIINGAFDADKLDYIQRDSHFTGIKMVLDLERLFHTVDLIIDDKGAIRLSVNLNGVSTLEQIVFNKMMLNNTIYHHQKVRAAECLYKDIFYQSILSKNCSSEPFNRENTVAFLYLTDDDIRNYANEQSDDRILLLANDLVQRTLPKRALVISMNSINNDVGLEKLLERSSIPEEKIEIRKAIAEEANNNIDESDSKILPNDILIDFPSFPSFSEASQCPIKTQINSSYLLLRQIMPIDEWARAFTAVKWNGFIFTKSKYRKYVFPAAVLVLRELFGIILDEELTKESCKYDSF